MNKRLPIIAIVGRANVGKSSLFNKILQRRHAIIAKEAGTTRDSLIERASFNNNYFWLVDTAGVKDPIDDFELTIQEQITEAIKNADIIWVVVEANIPITEDDRKVANLALKSKKPIYLIVNKIDQAVNQKLDYFNRLGIKPIFYVSVFQNKGIEELLIKTLSVIPNIEHNITNDNLKLAIIGRPNVGKSSLFNVMAKKQQAIVADRAGTTRDINRAEVKYNSQIIELIDTAGIRRNGKIEVGVEKFSVLRTINAIEQSDICLLVLDANELHIKLDQKLAGMIKNASKGLVIVITKWDIVEEKTAFKRDEIANKLKYDFDFVPWAPVVFISSVTGQNVTKIFELATTIYHNRQLKISTPKLNRWLKQTIDQHPPAGLKNRLPKLNYIVQETDNSIPAFKIFGSQIKFIHWSYKRYLEHQLRESFDYSGTAIEIWFIEKHIPHQHGVSPTKQTRQKPAIDVIA